MGITKQYLRYSPSGKFNIIASGNCNGSWVTLKNQEGRFVATGTCEDITVWDVNLVEKAVVLPGEKTVVTCLKSSPIPNILAAGFRDGSVKTYDVDTGEVLGIFSGHKQSVTCLTYDSTGHQLASGSNDTHIVVWDVVAEAGLSRLSGHTGSVTSVHFMKNYNILISCSKDTSIKFWDLDTSYCFKTLLGHRTEVWGIVLMRNQEFLVTGSGDSELRVWNLAAKENKVKEESNDDTVEKQFEFEEESDVMSPISTEKCGSILRTDTGRVSGLISDAGNQILAVHGTSGLLELFMFTSHLESLRRLKKRIKKENKGNKSSLDSNSTRPSLRDIVRRLPTIKLKVKIKSSDLVLGKNGELRIMLTLSNNTVEIYTLNTTEKNALAVCKRRIANQGHHSEVRVVSFCSDSLAVVTGSGDSVKLWNRNSLACIRTIATGYVLSLCLVPGDRHVVAGLKTGKLLIIDLNTGDILEEIPAHEKEIWSIRVTPDKRGCITGSSDHTVKFWEFELIDDKDNNSSGKVLSLLHVRTLTLDDGVLGVCVTPNSKLFAVSLLDMTVKIFFLDTMKFFLSLYGHKLPVLCMDISSDSTLIATGSADRNIKIWGLDFGDCHKSIFAHDDSVTSLEFVPGTHYFFSCGKDGKIKQWDADNFQKIITLEGHFGEAFHLSVSPNGNHLVSCGSDRVVRLVTKTEEPLILEDEAEEERAREEEKQLATDAETTVRGQSTLQLPSRKTVGSERGAEEILEGLGVAKEYLQLLKESKSQKDAKPSLPPLMVAYNASDPNDFILEIISRIRSSDLEEGSSTSAVSCCYPNVGNVPVPVTARNQNRTDLPGADVSHKDSPRTNCHQ
ncbi:UNVERIFIED_CONTAM: hypothetical protein PYX00_007902 [Menopon gallinae]|uniref:WD repeat-containing protein 3 n=1 Tax=Menopon gallinae TaxID=328185 RepID=A0AAW2HL32_9NEOP